MQVPTHAWGVSECEVDLRGELHSQVWIVQVSEERKKGNAMAGLRGPAEYG